MTGAMVKAPEALQMGLVNEVVEPDNLEEAVGALAQTLVGGPSIALGKVKKLVNESANLTEAYRLRLRPSASSLRQRI